jgi:hypothetical protein
MHRILKGGSNNWEGISIPAQTRVRALQFIFKDPSGAGFHLYDQNLGLYGV